MRADSPGIIGKAGFDLAWEFQSTYSVGQQTSRAFFNLCTYLLIHRTRIVLLPPVVSPAHLHDQDKWETCFFHQDIADIMTYPCLVKYYSEL